MNGSGGIDPTSPLNSCCGKKCISKTLLQKGTGEPQTRFFFFRVKRALQFRNVARILISRWLEQGVPSRLHEACFPIAETDATNPVLYCHILVLPIYHPPIKCNFAHRLSRWTRVLMAIPSRRSPIKIVFYYLQSCKFYNYCYYSLILFPFGEELIIYVKFVGHNIKDSKCSVSNGCQTDSMQPLCCFTFYKKKKPQQKFHAFQRL